MRKLLLLFLGAGISLSGMTTEPAGAWYVTGSGKTQCEKITLGMDKARIELQNGEKFTLPIDEITSYSIEGKVYNKVPLYKDGKPTSRKVFMELIKSHGDCSLYRYEKSIYEKEDRMIVLTTCCKYFVYRGDQFQLAIDHNSEPDKVQNVCKYFDVLAVLQKTP
jgi:hypothetical protein